MKSRCLKSCFAIAVVSSGICLTSDDSKELLDLREKLKSLEERVARLEGIANPKRTELDPPQNSEGLRDRVKKRFEQDASIYSKDELKEIERLYQVANKEWNSPEARASLRTLIEKYPKANRTGCALQYLGQMASGEEKEKYLKQAIKDFSDCYYGNGVQVGAYARLYLADYYQQAGKSSEADALCEEIRKFYPDSIDHKGKALKDILPK